MSRVRPDESAHWKVAMRTTSDALVPDGPTYRLVHACTTCAAVSTLVVATRITTTWFTCVVGFRADEIVVLEVTPDLTSAGTPLHLPAGAVEHARREVITGVYGLCPHGVKRKDELTLAIPSRSTRRGMQVMVDQPEERAAFRAFFDSYRAAVLARAGGRDQG
ncbi:MAG TPA: hypothetical protein VGC57_07230 [Cellulomonas sp.]